MKNQLLVILLKCKNNIALFKLSVLTLIVCPILAFSQPCLNNGGLGATPCDPILLSVNATCVAKQARTNGCGNFGNPGTCNAGTSPDVWGVFTIASTYNLTIRHSSNNKDATIHLFTLTGACGAFANYTQIGCSDNIVGTFGDEDIVVALLPAGTYYVRAEAIGQTGITGTGFCVFGTTVPTCSDGIQNQGETGIDCGGPCAAVCPPPTCFDGVQNQGEIGIDCGGPCVACPVDIIPTACANQTFNIAVATSFYDDGGVGGGPGCTDGAPGNYANANCLTTTTICAPSGNTLLANFNAFAMWNTALAFDWMIIYEGVGTTGNILFNNDVGGANHNGGFGNCGNDPLTDLQNICSNNSNCLTFEFNATTTISREGWDADILIVNGSGCLPLPATLTSFEGKPYNNYNLIEWTTASEINNDYFILESSYDGKNFKKLSIVNGSGNSNSNKYYNYIHYDPNDLTYYRLKQIDFDGKDDLSKVIAISSKKVDVSIHPNPSTDNLFFRLSESVEGTYTVLYASMMGDIHKEQIKITKGKSSYQVNDFVKLSAGIYFVQILNEKSEVIKQHKVIKQ
jgi:hypothetical protein